MFENHITWLKVMFSIYSSLTVWCDHFYSKDFFAAETSCSCFLPLNVALTCVVGRWELEENLLKGPVTSEIYQTIAIA